jgi:hypothetical protein
MCKRFIADFRSGENNQPFLPFRLVQGYRKTMGRLPIQLIG